MKFKNNKMLFIKDKKLGEFELEYDKVFLETNEPVLFTCINKNNEIFLGLLCSIEKNEKKWLLTKSSPEIIIGVLNDEITLRDAFLVFPEVQVSIIDNGTEYKVYYNSFEDWDNESSIYLPDSEEFMEAEDGEFDNEIEYFRAMLIDNDKKEN